jgi:hypothetical protein
MRVSVAVTEGRPIDQQVEKAELHSESTGASVGTGTAGAIIADRSIPARPAIIVELNSVITTADARRAAIQDDLFEASQLLNLAESVESSRVVEPAAASKTTARSSRTSLLIGALIGLLIGAIAALVADPIAARRRGAAAASS